MPNPFPKCKKRSVAGFSMVEAVAVVAIIGILTLLVVPRIEPILASRSVSGARAGFTNLYTLARMSAVQRRQRATISVTGGIAQATVDTGGGSMRVGSAIFFATEFGVQATASPTSVTIQPSGLVTTNLPFELELVKSSVRDTVRITGFGRLQ